MFKLNFVALFITVCAVACAETPDTRGYTEYGSTTNRSGNYYQNRYAPNGQTYGPTYYGDYSNDPGEYYRRRYVPGYAGRQDSANSQHQYQQYQPQYPQQQYYQHATPAQTTGYWTWVERSGKKAAYWAWVSYTQPSTYQDTAPQGYVPNPGYYYAQRYAPSHALRNIPQYIPAPAEKKRGVVVEESDDDKSVIDEDGNRWKSIDEYRRYLRNRKDK